MKTTEFFIVLSSSFPLSFICFRDQSHPLRLLLFAIAPDKAKAKAFFRADNFQLKLNYSPISLLHMNTSSGEGFSAFVCVPNNGRTILSQKAARTKAQSGEGKLVFLEISRSRLISNGNHDDRRLGRLEENFSLCMFHFN